MGDEAAGADGVVEAHPLLVVGVVAAPQEVLAARVVGLLVEHPAAAVHPDGVAAAEAGLQVGVVAVALVVAALEAPVLVEGDLQGREGQGSEAWPPARLRAPPAGAGLTFPMAAGCGDASSVRRGGRAGLYSRRAAALAGTTQKGPPGEEDFLSLFYIMTAGVGGGLIVCFLLDSPELSN